VIGPRHSKVRGGPLPDECRDRATGPRKSTFVGLLLADTGSLPPWQARLPFAARASARAAFEYAPLPARLARDDRIRGAHPIRPAASSRAATRDYIIIDAPGHMSSSRT